MRNLITLWICCFAYFNCAGWVLSALHELNFLGYSLALGMGAAGLVVCRHKILNNPPRSCWRTRFRRFRRPFPGIFLSVALLAFVGGVINAPNNYDALCYRLPRILNWLMANHWHWINSINERMNYSTPAWEWAGLPQLALLHSDRGLFLIDFTGFLLLPGLLFSVFLQLGIARRLAWTWMWVLPLAYGYSLQAGGIGNDLTGAVFCLAAVFYGLRARTSQRASDIWLCGLAAALLTGNKMSNLPLLLPCLVAVWPALPRLRDRWLGTLAVLPIALLISALPTMLLNQIHTGTWNGDPANKGRIQITNPVAGILGNGLLLAHESFAPPILPDPQRLNNWTTRHLPGSWRQMLLKGFPRFQLSNGELPNEEGAGLGIGISLPLLIALLAAIGGLGGNARRHLSINRFISVGFTAWVALLFFLIKMGSEADPRILLPYYPLVIAPLLRLKPHAWLLRFRSWQALLMLGGLCVLPAMILSPSRPLWPAVAISKKLAAEHPNNAGLQRLATVYATYAHRNDTLELLRNQLPATAHDIGFAALPDDSDYSLWRPLGQRRVTYLYDDLHPEVQLPANLEWLVVKQAIWSQISHQSLEAWAAEHHAKIVFSAPITVLVSWGSETWYVLHVEKAEQATPAWSSPRK